MRKRTPGPWVNQAVSVETNMKKGRSWFVRRAYGAFPFFILSVIGMPGCAKPVPLAFNTVCQKENDNKYVSVEGYLRTGTSVLCSKRNGTSSCGLELLEKPDGENKISVYVEEGTGTSQMEPLPKSYSKDDLKIHARDDQTLGPQDRVRIIGKVTIGGDMSNPSYMICYIEVSKIEKP